MRKIIILLCFVFITTKIFAQKPGEAIYGLKNDWSPANSLEEATYFMEEVKEDDTTFVCRYYQKFGPMIRQESYRDDSLNILGGYFAWYDKKGNIDSSGYVREQKKDGAWRYYDDKLKIYKSINYDKGKLLSTEDDIAKTITYADGRVESSKPADTIKLEQVAAKFKNGAGDWINYLTHNLRIPDRLLGIGKGGVVVVEFLIDKEGNVKDVTIRKSLEWSADAEALRIIKKSPQWTPAVQNGRNVYYHQVQSLTMSIN